MENVAEGGERGIDWQLRAEREEAERVALGIRNENRQRHVFAQIQVTIIARNADDAKAGSASVKGNMSAQSAAVREPSASGIFGYQGDFLGIGRIALIEIAPGQQRYPHGFGEPRSRHAKIGNPLLIGEIGSAGNVESREDAGAPERRGPDQCGGLNAGDRASARNKPAKELAGLRVFQRWMGIDDRHDGQIVGVETGIDMHQAYQGSSEKAGGSQQHNGERDLRPEQNAAEAETLLSTANTAGSLFERRPGAEPGHIKGRSEPECNPREEGGSGAEEEHSPIRMQIQDYGVVRG
jgi:hypothetical protein